MTNFAWQSLTATVLYLGAKGYPFKNLPRPMARKLPLHTQFVGICLLSKVKGSRRRFCFCFKSCFQDLINHLTFTAFMVTRKQKPLPLKMSHIIQGFRITNAICVCKFRKLNSSEARL